MPQSLLKIRDVGKSYGLKTILKEINLEIYKGEILSLLGVNGAGKSTLTSILASLHRPSQGEILWQNQLLIKQLSEYRKFMGYCPQEQTLDLSLTLRQILHFQGKYYGLSKSEASQGASHLIERFELTDYAESFPYLLSGGYKQRFLIAKALMHQPKFLILDEPSVGLDPIAREAMWQNLLQLNREGMTILFTTHHLHEAEKYADRVCVLHEGFLQTIDTPSRLKEKWQKQDLESVFLQLLSGENK